MESHQKSKQHQGNLETENEFQSKQTYLQLDQVNFKKQVVSSFIAADILLHKQNHPPLNFLFATIGKVVTSEIAAQAALLSSPKRTNSRITSTQFYFFIVDEAEVAKQKYTNVLVGRLDAPNRTFPVDCHPLDSGSNVNSCITLHYIRILHYII